MYFHYKKHKSHYVELVRMEVLQFVLGLSIGLLPAFFGGFIVYAVIKSEDEDTI
jgi:hypothetical protein